MKRSIQIKTLRFTGAFGGMAIICTIRLVANAAAIISSSDNKKYLVKQAKCNQLRARGRVSINDERGDPGVLARSSSAR